MTSRRSNQINSEWEIFYRTDLVSYIYIYIYLEIFADELDVEYASNRFRRRYIAEGIYETRQVLSW